MTSRQPWPFEDPPDTAVVTTTFVTRHRMPILYVSHEFDEEVGSSWQFHCGNGELGGEVLQLVAFREILAVDPGLVALARLPVGYQATRESADEQWVIAQMALEQPLG